MKRAANWAAFRCSQVAHRAGSKKSFHNLLKSLNYFASERVIDGVIHMRSPWTLSTFEAVIFSGLVLGLSGAALWVTVIL
jgi:hypothetical protein